MTVYHFSKKCLVIILLLTWILSACNKENNETPIVNKGSINGVVQKGPFLNGSSVGIYELDKDYSPTGKVFSTQMEDNSGVFEINNVSLKSQFVQLKAEGYYFNEVTGANSSSTLTLYALTDIKDKSSANVNIISHLEKSRMEHLIKNGMPFSDAKRQANQEVLKIFSIVKPDLIDSDLLDISKKGDDNAILLAISLITQGFRSESELSELLANIITDIKQDGILNSHSIGSQLINDAKVFNLSEIRNNIETRYDILGMNVEIPDFEKYLDIFIKNSAYNITTQIQYPEFRSYGENILYGDKSVFYSSNVSLAAHVPKHHSLKIVIMNGNYGLHSYPEMEDSWGWKTSLMNDMTPQIYEAHQEKYNDANFYFTEQTTLNIEIFENGSETPTKVKTITVIPD